MKIEFLSYDGEYPNLCRGQLVLRIDGEIHAFGYPLYCFDYESYRQENKDLCIHEQFWSSGGSAGVDEDGNDFCSGGSWEFDKKALPEFLKPHAEEIFDLFQANVEEGCCGGCI